MLLLILTWVVSHFRGGIIMIRPRQGGVEREVSHIAIGRIASA